MGWVTGGYTANSEHGSWRDKNPIEKSTGDEFEHKKKLTLIPYLFLSLGPHRIRLNKNHFNFLEIIKLFFDWYSLWPPLKITFISIHAMKMIVKILMECGFFFFAVIPQSPVRVNLFLRCKHKYWYVMGVSLFSFSALINWQWHRLANGKKKWILSGRVEKLQ